MARQRGHRFDRALVGDEARAHFGDNITTTNHYHVEMGMPSDTYNTLLASLTFDHMDERVRNVAAALPTTSGWLPSHSHFAAWTDDRQIHEHHGFLWLKGKPGSGKSTIMKETLVWAKQAWSDQIVLSYFFNARSPHTLEKSSLGLYRSLVWQLQTKLPTSHTLFVEQFALKIRRKEVAGETQTEVEVWTENELQNFLVLAVRKLSTPPITIFVDALDEGTEADVRRMVVFLECLTEHATIVACPLRICLSSRHYPHISVAKSLSVVVEHQAEHNRDIEQYIHRKLAGEERTGMSDLRRKVRDRSAGIFLWVVLVVPILNKAYDQGRNTATMLRKLETIPPDLHKVFTQIFFRDPDNLDECIALLQWVLFTKRPLEAIELYYAVQYSCCLIDSDEPVVVTLDVATKYLLNCSRGLIELTKTDKPVVQFIHETVRRYLTDGSLFEQRGPEQHLLHVSEQDFKANTCNLKLSEVCLRYILQNLKKISSIDEVYLHYPLAPYAAECWWQHLQSSPSSSGGRECELALELLTGGRSNLLFLTQLYDIDNGGSNPWMVTHRLAPPLYYAAVIGKQELALSILALGADVNAKGGHYGNALQAASTYGHEKIVQILLDRGANINAEGGRYGNVIQAASERGHEKVVQILLDRGANVNAKEVYYGRALQAASACGHEKVVQILLDRGANINAEGGHYSNTLYTASAYSHEKVVQLLLVPETYVEAKGGRRYGNALQAASACGHEKIVQILLDRGANINAEGGHYNNALQTASACGHEKIVQILLDRGANINAEGGRYGNALQAASAYSHEKIVEILLKHGARFR